MSTVEKNELRRPFLIAAKRLDKGARTTLHSDAINYLEPRSGAERTKTFAESADKSYEIDAPLPVVMDIFRENGYGVYDAAELAQRTAAYNKASKAPKP